MAQWLALSCLELASTDDFFVSDQAQTGSEVVPFRIAMDENGSSKLSGVTFPACGSFYS